MNKKMIKLLLILCSGSIALNTQAQVYISVDTSTVVASDVSNKWGMNLNAGVDSDLNREFGFTTMANALAETGSKHLRYPGGAKSQYYSWASFPYTNPSTNYWVPGAYADLAQNTMDFDDFMIIVNQIDAQAHINVAYNPNKGLGEDLAAKWVKYANVTNNHDIKYWEIGNEMWQNNLGLTVNSLCAVASSYSSAMKAEDPGILIGISWYRGQVQDVINTCGNAIDFVTISDYTTYEGSYSAYANGNNVNLIGVNESASKKIVVSEFAPTTWQQDTADYANSTGKGIINFDQIGQYLKSPNTLYAAFWNTHWYDLSGYMFDAMDNANNLLPVAQPMKLWAQFIKNDLVQISSNESDIVTYAAYDNATGDLNLFIANKGNSNQSSAIAINSSSLYEATASVTRFQGVDAWDENPTLSNAGTVNVSGNSITTSFPPTSITVIALTAAESLIENPGFETGGLDGWQLDTPSGWGGVTPDGKHSGAYSGWVGGGDATLTQTINDLTSNTTYKISSYVYNWNSDGGEALIGVNNSGGSSISESVGYTDWTLVEQTFTTGNSSTSADFYITNTKPDTWLRIDDVQLTEIPVAVLNGGFEDGLTNWNNWLTVTTSSSQAYSGNAALQLNGKSSAHQVIAVKSDTTYTISGYAKVVDPGNDRVVFGVNDLTNGNVGIANVQIYDTNYTHHQMTFKTGQNTNSIKVFFWRPKNGVQQAYLDNVSIVKVSP